jgi:hypothetical protein
LYIVPKFLVWHSPAVRWLGILHFIFSYIIGGLKLYFIGQMNFYFGGINEHYTKASTPSFEYAPSKNIFHIPSTSVTELTSGSVGIGASLYYSFTKRMQHPRSSSAT